MAVSKISKPSTGRKILSGTSRTLASGAVAITFDTPFSDVPDVVASTIGDSTGTVACIKTENTASGFTAICTRVASGNVGQVAVEFCWIAIGD